MRKRQLTREKIIGPTERPNELLFQYDKYQSVWYGSYKFYSVTATSFLVVKSKLYKLLHENGVKTPFQTAYTPLQRV